VLIYEGTILKTKEWTKKKSVLGKTIPVTGCGGPQGCETLRLPDFLDNWLTDGGEVVSLICWPLFTSRKISDTYF
jgi:hypothetical protein